MEIGKEESLANLKKFLQECGFVRMGSGRGGFCGWELGHTIEEIAGEFGGNNVKLFYSHEQIIKKS